MEKRNLESICRYRNEAVFARDAKCEEYISTESMVANRGGITLASSAPLDGKVRRYRKGDVLVSNIRPYFKKIWHASHDGACSNDVLVFEATKCDPNYLFWVLSSDAFFDYMMKTAKGTKMPRGDKKAIMGYQVGLPPVDQQKAICGILESLQEKIALNNRLNGYLADLVAVEFRKRFESNVPTVELGEVLSISTKTLKPQDHGEEIWEHYSIPSYDENRRPVFEQACCIKSNKYLIDSECILISKLNPSIKRIWMPACTSGRAVCSTEFIVYRPNNPEHRSFYYAAIDAPEFTDYLLAHVTGSTGSRQRTQPKATLAYPMQNPGNASIDDFCKFADPLYQQIQTNELESIRMEELRDALLPKLMSGEIDVSKVDLTRLNSHLADC